MACKILLISAAVPVKFAPDEDKKKAALEKFNGKLDGFIKNIEKILEENGGDWLVGKEFTWADLYVSVALHQVTFDVNLIPLLSFNNNNFLLQWTKVFADVEWEEKTPKLVALSKKVHDLPKIKAHMDSRPDAPF